MPDGKFILSFKVGARNVTKIWTVVNLNSSSWCSTAKIFRISPSLTANRDLESNGGQFTQDDKKSDFAVTDNDPRAELNNLLMLR